MRCARLPCRVASRAADAGDQPSLLVWPPPYTHGLEEHAAEPGADTAVRCPDHARAPRIKVANKEIQRYVPRKQSGATVRSVPGLSFWRVQGSNTNSRVQISPSAAPSQRPVLALEISLEHGYCCPAAAKTAAPVSCV